MPEDNFESHRDHALDFFNVNHEIECDDNDVEEHVKAKYMGRDMDEKAKVCRKIIQISAELYLGWENRPAERPARRNQSMGKEEQGWKIMSEGAGSSISGSTGQGYQEESQAECIGFRFRARYFGVGRAVGERLINEERRFGR